MAPICRSIFLNFLFVFMSVSTGHVNRDGRKMANICPDKKFIDYDKKICQSYCSDGYFTNHGSKICEKCDGNCETCNLGKTRCTSCPENLFFKNNTCVIVDMCTHTLIQNNNESTVRLVNGSSSLEGRIEIKVNGIWGTICDDMFTKKDGDVICRMLEMGHAIKTYSSGHFGSAPESFPIYIDDLHCDGTESSIDECVHSDFGVHDCSHKEDSGVKCSGPNVERSCVTSCMKGFYKVGEKCLPCHEKCASCEGEAKKCSSCFVGQFLQGSTCVSRCHLGHFGHQYRQKCQPCKDPSCLECDPEADGSVCKMCGFNTFLSHGKCEAKCGKKEVVQAFLNLMIRSSGRRNLELLNITERIPFRGDVYLETKEGDIDICDEDWDMADARVVCRQLGCETALAATRGTLFYRISRSEDKKLPKYMLTGFRCKGNEENILDCEHRVVETGKCPPSERAGVVCGFRVPSTYQSSPYKCLPSCSRGFYQAGAMCLLCSVECATCERKGTHCTSCKAPLFLSQRKCVSYCGIYEYGNNVSMKCLPCNRQKCGTCRNGDRDDICSSCTEPLVLWQDRCVARCPEGLVEEEGECKQKCGVGFYVRSDRCRRCPADCFACQRTEKSGVECIVCDSTKVLNMKGMCTDRCPLPSVEVAGDVPSDLLGLGVKLAGGGAKGYVLVKRGDKWVPLCQDILTQKEKQVICKELNLLAFNDAKTRYGTYGTIKDIGYVAKLKCRGNERSVSDCYQSPGFAKTCALGQAYIACQGSRPRICREECPTGHTLDARQQKCAMCSSTCATCYGNQDNCTSCPSDRVLQKNSCLTSCTPGFVEDTKTQVCVACDDNCGTCDESNPKHCRSCKRNYYLQNGSCVESCRSEYSVKLSSHLQPVVISIHSNEVHFRLKIKDGDRSGYVCADHAGQWGIEDVAVLCRELHFGGPIVRKETIYPSYMDTPSWMKPHNCKGNETSILECGWLRFQQDAVCALKMFTCTGPDLSRVCLPDCPPGYVVTAQRECQQCHPSCVQCNGAYNNCTECNQGYFRVTDGLCKLECPWGYYSNQNDVCEKCDSSCAACRGEATSCTACEGHSLLEDAKCIPKCKSGLFMKGGVSVAAMRLYWRLIPLLKTRQGDAYFPICYVETYNFAAVARVLCRTLGYQDFDRTKAVDYGDGIVMGTQCYDIQNVTCMGRENDLRECNNYTKIVTDIAPNFVHLVCRNGDLSKHCIAKCPNGFTAVGSECQRCSPRCKSCSNSSKTCSACHTPFYLQSRACVRQCKTGYYGNIVDRKCKPCDVNCSTCANGNEGKYCLTCKDGFVLYQSNCLAEPPPDSILVREAVSSLWRRSPLRLSNGVNGRTNEGLLEVYYDGHWGSVCASQSNFMYFFPTVACFELGFQGSVGWLKAKDVVGLKKTAAMDRKTLDLQFCNPDELSTAACMHSGFGVTACSNDDAIYVNCTKQLVSTADFDFYQNLNGMPCKLLAQGCSSIPSCLNVQLSATRKDSVCVKCPTDSIPSSRQCRWVVDEAPTVVVALKDITADEGETVDLEWTLQWSKLDQLNNRERQYDAYPRWYKDGKLITFNSVFASNHDIFPYFGLRRFFVLTVKAMPQTSGNYTSVFSTTAGDYTNSMVLTVRAKPFISLAVSPRHPKLDESCELRCESPDQVTWSWQFGGKPVKGDGYDVSKPGSLVIKKLKPSDVGQYKCIAENKVGQAMALLEVQPAVTIKSITAPDHVIVPEGGTATLTCAVSADGPIKVIWKAWGKALPLNSKYSLSRLHQGTLTVTKVSVDEQAIYTCVAISDSMIKSKDVQLLLQGNSPHIYSSPQDVFAIRTAIVRFHCHAIGVPPLTYTWLRNNDVIQASDTHARISSDGTSLELLYVHHDQSALYTCRVRNAHGSDQRAAYLRVLEVDIPTGVQNHKLKKGEKAFLPSFGDAIFQVVFGPILGAIILVVAIWCVVKYVRRRRRRASGDRRPHSPPNGAGTSYTVKYHIQERHMDMVEEEEEEEEDNLEVVRYDDQNNPERARLVPGGLTILS